MGTAHSWVGGSRLNKECGEGIAGKLSPGLPHHSGLEVGSLWDLDLLQREYRILSNFLLAIALPFPVPCFPTSASRSYNARSDSSKRQSDKDGSQEQLVC